MLCCAGFLWGCVLFSVFVVYEQAKRAGWLNTFFMYSFSRACQRSIYTLAPGVSDAVM